EANTAVGTTAKTTAMASTTAARRGATRTCPPSIRGYAGGTIEHNEATPRTGRFNSIESRACLSFSHKHLIIDRPSNHIQTIGLPSHNVTGSWAQAERRFTLGRPGSSVGEDSRFRRAPVMFETAASSFRSRFPRIAYVRGAGPESTSRAESSVYAVQRCGTVLAQRSDERSAPCL